MKRLLSIFLGLALTLSYFPASVFADDVVAYDLWIGNVQVTSTNTQGEGWSYSGTGEAGTLTLTNANITDILNDEDAGVSCNIYSKIGDLTIKLSGTNKVGDPGSQADTGIAASGGSLTIEGKGKLSVVGTDYAIYSVGSLEVSDADVTASSNDFVAIYCNGMTVTNATVKATAKEHGGIDVEGDAVITDSTVTAVGGSNNHKIGSLDGIWCNNLIVTDSELNVSNVSSTVGDTYEPCGVRALESIKISGSTVTAATAYGHGLKSETTMDIADSKITTTASGRGSGLASGGNMTISNSELDIKSNNHTWYYGAISSENSNVKITDSKVYVETKGDSIGIYAKGGLELSTAGGEPAMELEVNGEGADADKSAIYVRGSEITMSDDLAVILPDGGVTGAAGDTSSYYTVLDGEAPARHVIIKSLAHKITVAETTNGTAAASAEKAVPGDEIKVTATPDEGYELDSIKYTDAAGTETDITDAGKFTMPGSDVTVTVTFKAKEEKPDPDDKKVEPAVTYDKLIAKMTSKGKKSLAIKWNKIKGVDGYEIFLSKCNSKGRVEVLKNVATVSGSKVSWTQKGLKAKTAYKAYVKAYVMKDRKKSYIGQSPLVHAYTSGGNKKFTNPKRVTVKKAKLTLKAGKTSKIKATVKKLKKGKKLISKAHAAKLRYMSSNTKVATVSKAGKIKAIGKGACKIYVYAANGVSKTVSVTVK